MMIFWWFFQVILLDTRYHRDPLFSNGDVLGEGQWTWLERQLRENEAQITIIGSSIQVITYSCEYYVIVSKFVDSIVMSSSPN